MKVGDVVRIKKGFGRLVHKSFIGQIGIIVGLGHRYTSVHLIGKKIKFMRDELKVVCEGR
tara:strand:- start:616 stop:795 length:180 start_codon:yes stop_codon:yes gene_type:complete